MMNRFLFGTVLAFGLCVVAGSTALADGQKSTVRGAASAAKDVSTGVVSDALRIGRVVSFPVRHPVRTLRGIGKGVKAVGLGGLEVLVTIIGPGVSR